MRQKINMILSVLIFLLVGLVYIYILHQWKYNDNLEIFELDYIDSPTQIQNACDLRQPLIMPSLLEHTNPTKHAESLLKVGIKDARSYHDAAADLGSVDMTLKGALVFFKASPPHYFSEGNAEFLRDSGMLRQVQQEVDVWLKPPACTVYADYDYLLGNATETPFRYHTHNRRFLCVVGGGPLHVRLAPWKAINHHIIKDYEFYEFYTRSTPPTTFSVTVHPGQMLYVPPYWWYALDFSAGDVVVIQCSYVTVMNAVAHAQDLILYALQQQNIKTHVIDHGSPQKSEIASDPPPPHNVSPEPVRQDVHRQDPVEHVALGQGVSLEHEIVQ